MRSHDVLALTNGIMNMMYHYCYNYCCCYYHYYYFCDPFIPRSLGTC